MHEEYVKDLYEARQYIYMYVVLITCFRELLLKGQVLTNNLNSKVHKAKIERKGKW